MKPNRSMAPGTIIPEFAYADVREAVEWLCRAFGFAERMRIGNHRAQLTFGGAAVVVTKRQGEAPATGGGFNRSVLVRVADANRHHETAVRAGARIVSPPTDYPYGERQYTAEDPGGYQWTFSETIADVDPADWGGELQE